MFNVCFGDKKDCSAGTEAVKGNKDGMSLSISTISQNSKNVKVDDLLRDLRLLNNVSSKEIVQCVKAIYPKFDKSLQSKCENGKEYGITLLPDAVDALVDHYDLTVLKNKKIDHHRLKCRISCRLETEEYAELIRFIKEDGFEQMQAWLAYNVRRYLKIKKNEKENNNHGN